MDDTNAVDEHDPNTVDPVMYVPPTVVVAGTTYTLRRLGLPDVFRVVKILGRGAALLDAGSQFTPAQIIQVIMASITLNEEPVLDLIASLIGVKREALNDPEAFPMDSIIDIVEAIAKHGDLRGFLARADAIAKKMPNLAAADARR